MKLCEKNGKLSIENNGVTLYSDLYVGARYQAEKYNMKKTYTGQKWTLSECEPFAEDVKFPEGCTYYRAESENCRLFAAAGDGEIFIRTEYDNDTQKWAEPFDGFGMIALGGLWHEAFDRAVYNGQKDCNGIRVLEMQSESSLKIFGGMDILETAVHTAFIDTAGEAFSAGFVTHKRYFSYVFMREEGVLEFGLNSDNRCIKGNTTIKSDWIRIAPADSMQSALSEFAYAIKELNGIRLRFDHAPTGFCSWYYYMGGVTENAVFENLEVLDKIKDKAPFEVFQIDDGWGTSHADGNDKFPKGMRAYADSIKEHGMTAGIWLTPFNFGPWESVVKEHPEWFIHQGENLKELWGWNLIDATHPGAQKYIADIYHKITYDWGYRYIKLDLITTYISGGDFYNKDADALFNMREYFRIMRESIHPDTFVLACTAPLFETAEFFDGVRTSGDIFESWESMHGVFRRNLTRWYLNGVLYYTDPDCFMVRTGEEEDEECMRPVSRTKLENRTFATAMYTCGGALMISDKLPLLKEEQLADYARFFPHRTESGVPLDLAEEVIPSVFDLGEEDGVHTVSFINWGDKPKEFAVAFDGKRKATEHWDGTELGEFCGEYSVTLPPHGSQLVHLKKVEE